MPGDHVITIKPRRGKRHGPVTELYVCAFHRPKIIHAILGELVRIEESMIK